MMMEEAARADVAPVRAKAAQLAAEKKTPFHTSEVSVALAGKGGAVKEAAEMTSGLPEGKRLLDKERDATKTAVVANEAARADIAAVRGEAKAAQLAAEKKTTLHASEVSAALTGKRAAVKKAAALASRLSEAKKLLTDELSAKAKAVEAEEAVPPNSLLSVSGLRLLS